MFKKIMPHGKGQSCYYYELTDTNFVKKFECNSSRREDIIYALCKIYHSDYLAKNIFKYYLFFTTRYSPLSYKSLLNVIEDDFANYFTDSFSQFVKYKGCIINEFYKFYWKQGARSLQSKIKFIE